MKKIWVALGIVLIVMIGVVVSIYSIELTGDNIMTLEIGRGGQYFLMGLDETEVKDLTDDLEQLAFRLSIITPKSSGTTKYDILVRDKSGKGIGVIRVYDEENISYSTSFLGVFPLEYRAKDGSINLEKLSFLAK